MTPGKRLFICHFAAQDMAEERAVSCWDNFPEKLRELWERTARKFGAEDTTWDRDFRAHMGCGDKWTDDIDGAIERAADAADKMERERRRRSR